MSCQPPSAARHWLTRHGVKTYPSFRSMPVSLRLTFMVLFGIEYALATLQFGRVAPDLHGIERWFFGSPHPFSQLNLPTALLLLVVAGYTAWLAAVWWVSRGIFRTCERSLSDELFR